MAWSRSTWDAESWRHDAACRDQEPATFFPVGSTGAAVALIVAAKEVCASCPVAEECLIFAVTTNQEYGVWGGLDEDERRDVRRGWRRRLRRPAATLTALALAEDDDADEDELLEVDDDMTTSLVASEG